MDELSLFTLTSPPLLFKQTGSFLHTAPTELSPSLHFKLTGSSLQCSLMSSSPNTEGRASTVHNDEPLTSNRRAPLCHSYWQTLPDGQTPIIHRDEPLTAFQANGLPLSNNSTKPTPLIHTAMLLLFQPLGLGTRPVRAE